MTKYQKDAEEEEPLHFDLMEVSTTDSRTSLVPVLRQGVEPSLAKQSTLTDEQRTAIKCLWDVMIERGVTKVPIGDWRERCVQAGVSAAKKPKDQKRSIRDLTQKLIEREHVRAAIEHGSVGVPNSEWLASSRMADRGSVGITGELIQTDPRRQNAGGSGDRGTTTLQGDRLTPDLNREPTSELLN
jgi:hypothetical protein